MAILKEIGTTGVAGLRPTPVQSVIINNYLVTDELMNILRFVPIGMGNTLGNFVASFVTSDGDVEATFRDLGINYDENNQEFNTETVQLKMLGGALTADRAIQRAFGNGGNGIDMYTEAQIVQKLNAIKKAFAKWFIQGNATTDKKQFDGIEAKISKSQIIDTPIDFSTISISNLGTIEQNVNDAFALMRHTPTFLLTTRSGKSSLTSFNSQKYAGIKAITVNDMEYEACMGIPVIALDNDCFKASDLTDKIPVYGIYTDENEGVRIAIPNDGKVIDILYPKFENGKVVETGTCEMIVTPIFADKLAMVKFYITRSSGTNKENTESTEGTPSTKA